MVWSQNRCIGHKFWYFTRNIFNGYVGSFKILFEASSQACSAILPTVWKPGFKAHLQYKNGYCTNYREKIKGKTSEQQQDRQYSQE